MSQTNFGGDQLLAYVERVEAIEEEIKASNDDKSDIYKEAKGNGYDAKAIKTLVRERAAERKNPGQKKESDAVLDTYRTALHEAELRRASGKRAA